MLNRLVFSHCFRFSEIYPKNPDLSSSGTTFQAIHLIKNLRGNPLIPPQFNKQLPFGKYHSDHMISVDWSSRYGWNTPILKDFQNVSLHPFSSSLHYGIQCFEGLKAFKNKKGQINIFRPWCNAMRLKKSSVRLTLPDFDGQELFVKIEQRWIPAIDQCSFYIRPLHLSFDETLGVKKPDQSRLFIFGCPVGSYYPKGFKPISLSCATQTIRSAHKGTGAFKIGGNYAPTLQASSKIITKKFDQALWLLQNKIIEVGSSNIFFIFKDKSTGVIQIATPSLEDLILPGVTRDSVLELLRDEKQYKVSQRQIFIEQFIERHKKGEVIECFGTGTAVIVSPVQRIEHKGIQYSIPASIDNSIAYSIRRKLLDIQTGAVPDKYGWNLRVK